MPTYRIRRFDAENDNIQVEPLSCSDEETAIRIARAFPDATLLEIWEDDKLVGIVNLSISAHDGSRLAIHSY